MKNSEKLSFFYKVKFLLYFFGAIITLVFLLFESIFYFFDDDDDYNYFFPSLILWGNGMKENIKNKNKK